MKTQDAINLLDLSGAINADTIKAAYRRACSKYHPDKGGNTEMMQAVNAARDALNEYTQAEYYNPAKEFSPASDYAGELFNAITLALALTGLTLEVCGNWLWITGDTKQHRQQLKAHGFRWATKKKAWYYRPQDYSSANRGKWDMDKIRAHHGSTTVKNSSYTPIKAA